MWYPTLDFHKPKKKCKVRHRHWRFSPTDDITKSELFMILAHVTGKLPIGGEVIDTERNPIPKEICRHFVRILG